MTDLTTLPARRMVDLLRRREIGPGDAIDAALARIGAVDPAVNALPTLCPDRARAAGRRIAAGDGARDGPGWLAGLPIAVTDLTDVAGVRTTYGSVPFADNVPEVSDLAVETLEGNGAVVLAKANTAPFGAGGSAVNRVFGATRNPWQPGKTCGGSSGGAAAALASGQAWLATGSDFGGGLRTPAAFCAVVGLRPSPGRVARGPTVLPFDDLRVDGPMGRTVGDVALMLDAMAGAHAADPLAVPPPAAPFVAAVDAPEPPRRIAFTADMGLGPVAPAVAEACERAAGRFHDLKCAIDEAGTVFAEAPRIFRVLRAARYGAAMGQLLDTFGDAMAPEVVGAVEAGLRLTADDLGRARRARGRLFYRVAELFSHYDLLLCPAVAVTPFDVDQETPGPDPAAAAEESVDWMALTAAVTLTACPALSLPCGFGPDGMPIGLQMVAPPRGEAALLAAAALAEDMFGIAGQLPIEPRPPE